MTTAPESDSAPGGAVQSQLLDAQRTLWANALTGINLSLKEALKTLGYIKDHKWYLSERLGRDVGTYVAAVDYFENIYRARGARPK